MTNTKRAWTGLVAGAAGGLVGALVMNQIPPLWNALYKSFCEAEGCGHQREVGNEDVEATRNAAQAIAGHLLDRTLSEQELDTAGPALHYAIGALMGALYGVASHRMRILRAGRGTVYGGVVWLLGDEIGMPALGLLGPLKKTPLSSQLSALGSHVAYGFATDFVSRLVLGNNRT